MAEETERMLPPVTINWHKVKFIMKIDSDRILVRFDDGSETILSVPYGNIAPDMRISLNL